jgi:hypothetical protein
MEGHWILASVLWSELAFYASVFTACFSSVFWSKRIPKARTLRICSIMYLVRPYGFVMPSPVGLV